MVNCPLLGKVPPDSAMLGKSMGPHSRLGGQSASLHTTVPSGHVLVSGQSPMGLIVPSQHSTLLGGQSSRNGTVMPVSPQGFIKVTKNLHPSSSVLLATVVSPPTFVK